MKPGICTSFNREIPFPQLIEMIGAAGFEVVSFGGKPEYCGCFTPEGRREIQNLLDKNNMTINSLHAPFPEGDKLFSVKEDERIGSLDLCKSSIEAAGALNAGSVVLHMIQPYGVPEGDLRNRMIDKGIQSVGELADHAAEAGVKLALENGQKEEYDQVVIQLLNEFSNEHVGFCYDIGHEHVKCTGFDLLEKYADRLLVLHIHDNEGTDTHKLPFEGTIDWERFSSILKGLDYSGSLLLEVMIANSEFKEPEVFVREAYERAGRIIK